MQHAARYVALENTRLRTLLARHGVQQAEVDAYLRSCDESEGSQGISISIDTLTTPRPSQHASSASTSQCVANAAQATTGLPPANRTLEASGNSQLRTSKHQSQSPAADAPVNRPSEFRHTAAIQAADQTSRSQETRTSHASEAPDCPNTSDCFCPPTITPSSQAADNSLEISCETAASIIIEMRGEGDVDSIRASLGCAGRQSCTVRNSTVLQIMDEG